MAHGRFYSVKINPILGKKAVFSCSISKKNAPLAVDRNREKRRCRAIFSSLSPRTAEYRVQIKKNALGASFKELTEELTHLIPTTLSPGKAARGTMPR